MERIFRDQSQIIRRNPSNRQIASDQGRRDHFGYDDKGKDYIGVRCYINGTDRNEEIANYATLFESFLT